MMKIPRSIRELHGDLQPQYEVLKKKVDDLITSRKSPNWHYASRLKTLESYSQKLETGRVDNPRKLDDFFACTLVVQNYNEITDAKKIIEQLFEINSERPNEKITKRSDSFPFDDLRMYALWRDDPALPKTELDGFIFEIQIKTFLQHAWSIATHDLIYKSEVANWAKERIAYQIKAMLEHAEISISEASGLADSKQLVCRDSKLLKINKINTEIKDYWVMPDLPRDTKRLSENLYNLFECLELDWSIFKTKIDVFRSTNPWPASNISVYCNFVQIIITLEPNKIRQYLEDAIRRRSKPHILITPEIELPSGWDKAQLKNALFI